MPYTGSDLRATRHWAEVERYVFAERLGLTEDQLALIEDNDLEVPEYLEDLAFKVAQQLYNEQEGIES